jgi:hypothetical protein
MFIKKNFCALKFYAQNVHLSLVVRKHALNIFFVSVCCDISINRHAHNRWNTAKVTNPQLDILACCRKNRLLEKF